ncbi:hypothetical protein Q5P01_026022 [Channa striata]|uniref:Ig-like domain-containing protein n=1 Tax=Channa striata TaxID=64152 RepID=A0AA88J1V9_CHASR|nr:hypothetical protein Q5P01_026022 [Channa striata]
MEGEQLSLLFLFMVMSSSAAKEGKNLSVTEGGSITFPDPVLEFGFLLYENKNLAMVTKSEMQIVENIYMNRVHWNKNTGIFTMTDVQRNDSGIYSVDSKKGQIFTTAYEVTVYGCPPAPAVKTVSVNPESCFLLCFVDKGEDTTLLWYKEKEVVNQSSSALSLPLTVHKEEFRSSYRCEAATPAEEKTLSVDVNSLCGQTNTTSSNNRHSVTLIVVPIVLAITILFVAILIRQKYLLKKERPIRQTQGPEDTRDVLYTDVQFLENRRSEQSEEMRDPSGTVYGGSNLKTVYDKLEPHRMKPEYSELS